MKTLLALEAIASNATPAQFYAAMTVAVPADLMKTLEFALATGMTPEAIAADATTNGKRNLSPIMEQAFINALRWRKRQMDKPAEETDRAKAARAEMRRLVTEHNLGEMMNPGGREFSHPQYGRCMISDCDDVEDLRRLQEWLNSHKTESPVSAGQ